MWLVRNNKQSRLNKKLSIIVLAKHQYKSRKHKNTLKFKINLL